MFNEEGKAKNYYKEFAGRVSHLRRNKGVSARDMSLSLGQNPGYINAIENCRTLPKMGNFFEMCEYLNITPLEFFDTSIPAPVEHKLLYERIKKLDRAQLEHISALINDMTASKLP